jgi:RNA binding exosome subunit
MNTKNKLINQIDVGYREIENFDTQFEIMHYILNQFGEDELRNIKANIDKKIDDELADYIEDEFNFTKLG